MQSNMISASVLSLLMLVVTVMAEIKMMHPVGRGGAMVSYDVSYDAPDYHYVAQSPLGGGFITGDVSDNFIPAVPGLSAFPPYFNTGLGGGLRYNRIPSVQNVRNFPMPARRYGGAKRVRLIRI